MSLGVTDTPSVPPAVPDIPRKSFFARLAGVLFAPAETFDDIARKPDVLAPIALLIVIGIASTIVLVPRMDFETMMRTQMQQSGRQMKEADMDRVVRMGKAFATTTAYASPVLAIAFYVLIAGILLLAFRLFGGEGTFTQALSVTLYSWVPLTLFSIILALVAFSHGTIDPATVATVVKSNPAFLVDFNEQRVLYALLSSFDVFVIWTLILLTFGFSAVSKLSKGVSVAIVFSLWIAGVIVKVGFAAMGAAKMKG
jgi:hypothetical protein